MLRGVILSRKTPAIILSGGASSRLGQSKAMVRINDETLLAITVKKLALSGCSPIVVVVNKTLQFDAVMNANGASVVVNKNPETGRTGSFKVGINSVVSELGRVPKSLIMAPIDRPGWRASHVVKLCAQKTSSCLAEGGQRGHPVLVAKQDLLNVMSSSDDTPLKEIVNFAAVEITGGLLSLNIDTPNDLVTLEKYTKYFREL